MADISEEEQELLEILKDAEVELMEECEDAGCEEIARPKRIRKRHDTDKEVDEELKQWATNNKIDFFPTSSTVDLLDPGVYSIKASETRGIYFSKENIGLDGLVRFQESNNDKVLAEIKTFWEREEIYVKNKIHFKRGILLWGPPGTGKTCLIKLLIEDIIKREGVVFKFEQPDYFAEGMKIFRRIQPNTPLVVIMEDIDSLLENYNESRIINILDGVDVVHKVVFIATTNYPEKLGKRIVNRPSRFDTRLKIGNLTSHQRYVYFEHLFEHSPTHEIKNVNIDKWIGDTTGMSIAHLKELFTGVIILGAEYDVVIKRLKSMMEIEISSSDDENSDIGFATEAITDGPVGLTVAKTAKITSR